jgi:hypothetical protein
MATTQRQQMTFGGSVTGLSNESIPGSIAFAVCWFALEKKPENYLAFLHFACGLIAFRAAGVL